ncbi:PQQ-dependent sugar dehydrogenase [Dyella flava]|uniref:PQQ-dependent sugar dehydrogenase n=1 Tax=Dyella flava TaxID=1920170 RepID=A0ABS2JZM8_9GAMM|nr:PQQ-dependent sugar dehydrogenase [Dyella flava]MBM7123927.1 PQQ-dependent sugar dehydrogenase [Dyella flava]GLQ52546.1 sorbosone dehydrogenase [Dyella flava]
MAKHSVVLFLSSRPLGLVLLSGFLGWLASPVCGAADTTAFHDVPSAAAAVANPYGGQPAAISAGGQLYAKNCASCHGGTGQGTGNIPALAHGATQQASDGALFWFITKGAVNNGMPSWAALPEQQRWQIVAYLKALPTVKAAPTLQNTSAGSAITTPPPQPPFTDFRYESPGNVRKITLSDLPAPYATQSAGNAPTMAPRPAGVLPLAPKGFKVNLYAHGLDTPRVIRVAPNGDIFLAESGNGQIRIFRGMTADGKPQQTTVFATGLNRPYGIAFYPLGPNPQWVYVGDTDAVVRFPYRNGDLHARGEAQHIVDLPHGEGHWTRDVAFSRDNKTMYVAVGSGSNVDDPDTTPAEKDRADILAFDPDGSHMRIYAWGIRNPSGIAIDPGNGQLWTTVNERDGLGDNLVPDYITSVREGGFYGWPWWYMGSHQDPRHAGKHPELKDKVITPDVILQPHNASLQITFYEANNFPAEYKGDLFAAEHGSWNRSTRVGYEVIRIPRHHTSKATGEYEDFLTGFVLPDGRVWGRPVSVTAAPDGSLLVTDDGSNSIWRVDYVGAKQ